MFKTQKKRNSARKELGQKRCYIWNTCWVYDVTYDSNSIYPLYFLVKEALWETEKAALNCRKYNTTFHQGLRTFQRKGLHFGNIQNL